MSEEKRNRIIGAITVTAVLLIVIIFAVVIYQIVEISVLSARRDKLVEEQTNLEQELQDKSDLLEKYNLDQEMWLKIYALQNGYSPKK